MENGMKTEEEKEKGENIEEGYVTEIGKYTLVKIIGKGTFAVVYLGVNKEDPSEKVAIKRYFRNLHPNLCQLEISIISYLNKKTDDPSILKIYDGYKINDEVFLVMPYQPNIKFQDYFMEISLINLKRYMFNLLSCLESIHKTGIVHRDLKPDNFLYDINTNQCLLIDFGLAEADIDTHRFFQINATCPEDEDFHIIIELQKKNIRHRTGTRGFLAPEIIFNAKIQSTPVDIWAAGVIFLCFLARRLPVFNLNKFSTIKDETIKEIEPLILVFGKDKVTEIARKFNIFYKYTLAKGLKTLIIRNDITEDAIDLLYRLMELDPEKRITAEQAKNHRFFDEIKN